MANALSTLFQDIADAIRSKTGESSEIKIKPAEFPSRIADINASGDSTTLLENVSITPDFSSGNQTITTSDGEAIKSAIIQKPDTLIPANIASGVTIAGIVGELVTGGASGSKELKYSNGDFTPTSGTMTVSHNLGCVPDLIIVCCTHGGYATSKLLLSFAFSSEAISAFGGTSPGVSVPSSAQTSAITVSQSSGFENTAAPMIGIYAVTENSFTVGGSLWGLSTVGVYKYVAISGIV